MKKMRPQVLRMSRLLRRNTLFNFKECCALFLNSPSFAGFISWLKAHTKITVYLWLNRHTLTKCSWMTTLWFITLAEAVSGWLASKSKAHVRHASTIVCELKSENAEVTLFRVPTYTDHFGFSAKTFYWKTMVKNKHKIFSVFVVIGNTLTVLGCVGLGLGLVQIFNFDQVAFGLSSGIRIVGSVAISGCLLSAIGHGFLDYSKS